MDRLLMRFAWILVFFLSVGHAYGAKAAGTTASPMKSPPPKASVEEPSLDFPETTHDFGEVMEGTEVVHEFKVRNKGNAVLHINQVRPG